MRHVKPPSSTMYALRCQPEGCRFFPPSSHTAQAGLVHRQRLRGTPASPCPCGFNDSHTSPDFACKSVQAFTHEPKFAQNRPTRPDGLFGGWVGPHLRPDTNHFMPWGLFRPCEPYAPPHQLIMVN
jgi:hypothetical protein